MCEEKEKYMKWLKEFYESEQPHYLIVNGQNIKEYVEELKLIFGTNDIQYYPHQFGNRSTIIIQERDFSDGKFTYAKKLLPKFGMEFFDHSHKYLGPLQ